MSISITLSPSVRKAFCALSLDGDINTIARMSLENDVRREKRITIYWTPLSVVYYE